MHPQFPLDSHDCSLLVAFSEAPSVASLAMAVGRDPSVVSRQLQRIAEAVPVLEKRAGRWTLTATGEKIVSWARDAARSQRSILAERSSIRIATTREFAARVLAPRLHQLIGADSRVVVSVHALESGVEDYLRNGGADIGFDCGRPRDPSIKFRSLLDEPFVVVATKEFLRRHKVHTARELLAKPHLQYDRATAVALFGLKHDLPHVAVSFNDLASVRAAARASLGWAVVPHYAVVEELERNELVVIEGFAVTPERFGVFWMRDRPGLDAWVERAAAWLSLQSLVPAISHSRRRAKKREHAASS